MGGNRRQVVVGFEEGDVSKISGQDFESIVADDALLLAMPLLHLPALPADTLPAGSVPSFLA
jgi:hypothetical protein